MVLELMLEMDPRHLLRACLGLDSLGWNGEFSLVKGIGTLQLGFEPSKT